MYSYFVVFSFISLLLLLNAQLNPTDAPWVTWSNKHLTSEDHTAIISTINSDALCSDTKDWTLLPHIFTHDAVASDTAGVPLSHGIEAIKHVRIHGAAGFITQHLLSNFLVEIYRNGRTANASYYAIATLFTNPQQTPGQYVNLYGYYNDKLVKTDRGWRIDYLEYIFFGPGWTGNLTILPPGHPMAHRRRMSRRNLVSKSRRKGFRKAESGRR